MLLEQVSTLQHDVAARGLDNFCYNDGFALKEHPAAAARRVRRERVSDPVSPCQFPTFSFAARESITSAT
jgi:hypothetical protein